MGRPPTNPRLSLAGRCFYCSHRAETKDRFGVPGHSLHPVMEVDSCLRCRSLLFGMDHLVTEIGRVKYILEEVHGYKFKFF